MALWQETFTNWATAWGAIRSLSARTQDGVVVLENADGALTEIIGNGDAAARFPAPAGMVTLVGDSSEALAEATQGWRDVRAMVLLTAATDDMNASPKLPPNVETAEAPMETYDLVEISLFDKPVLSGRIAMEDDVAFVGGFETYAPEGAGMEHVATHLLAEEAFVHGADTLFTVVAPEVVADFEAAGWSVAAHVVTGEVAS